MNAVAKDQPEDRLSGPHAAVYDLRAGANAKEEANMEISPSWLRVALTIVIDWRFVMALVLLIAVLLLR